MTMLQEIADRMKKELPLFRICVCKGLFKKYIAVESHGEVLFTVWVDKKTGYMELLDEVSLFRNDWLKKRLKSSIFHWSKYPNLWQKNYPGTMMQKLKLNLPERKLLKKRVELSLQNIHIV